ncbi:MAG TPA: hypothetical protein DCG47_11650 [Spirochaetaceae bacterium]|jgi:hypothetical protein|nr:hypothetical protein [Spirochaetaceae bacterium]
MAIAVAVALAVLGCASAPTATIEDDSTQAVLIQVQGLGLSATGNVLFENLGFLQLAGSNVHAEGWAIEIADAGGQSGRKAGGNGAAPST